MTLLRRAPREVFRVYGEDEFLEGLDREQHPDAEREELPDMAERREEATNEPALMAAEGVVGRRRRRLAVMTTLGGTACALAVMVGASMHPSTTVMGSRLGPRPLAEQRDPVTAMPAARGVRSYGTGIPVRRPLARAFHRDPPRIRRARVAERTVLADAMPAQRAVASEAPMPTGAAGVGGGVRPATRIEFGFER